MPPTASKPEPTRMPIPGSGTVVASVASFLFFHHPFPHCFEPSPQPSAFSPLLLQPCSLASARAIAGASSATARMAASRRFFMVTPVGNVAKRKTAQSLCNYWCILGSTGTPERNRFRIFASRGRNSDLVDTIYPQVAHSGLRYSFGMNDLSDCVQESSTQV
jgi:hypothetical protein